MKYRDRDARDRPHPEDAHRRHRRGHRHYDENHHHREDRDDRHDGHHGHRGRHGRHGQRGGRPFDYGELRLLVLWMIEEQPRHGYELMRAIEERMGGSYSPSPGVIYPTLAWLEDMGYARVEAEGGRKSYAITEEGRAFLTANRAAIDDMHSRMGTGRGEGGRYEGVPAPIVRGMENLKLALRLRLRRGLLEQVAVEQIATALDAAAQAIERS
jgi:DNA-binding PadR family transcriptional regulator